jgi:16S rRNA A1518/A1519 N6-dimethyltransferase RsmA/KsgA/DIM1 with predicted DNA glycosylase/AP lyase activity
VLYLGYALLVFLIPIFFGGAVFAQTQQSSIHKIITLANPKPGQKAVDVGSGDGRLVIALAKSGVQAHGYEINPWLVLVSRLNIKKSWHEG